MMKIHPYKIVLVLLIITMGVLIVIINYISLRETTPPAEDYIIKEFVGDRMWNVFDEYVFRDINELFDSRDIEEDVNGKFISVSKKLVRGYDEYRFHKECPKIIPKGTLIIFPNNDVSWSDLSFYLTDTLTKNIIYPEPNSLIIAPNDLFLNNTQINLILAYGKNGDSPKGIR